MMSVVLSGAIDALTACVRSALGSSVGECLNKWVDPFAAPKSQALILSSGSEPEGDATIVVHAVCLITLIGKKAEDLPELQLAAEEKLWGAVHGASAPPPIYRIEIKRVEHYEPLPGAPCRGITEADIDLAINYL
jgi:hypothetical protein